MYGTLTLNDLQAETLNTTIYDFGEDRAYQAVQTTLAQHNQLVAELVDELAEVTTDRQDRYGDNQQMEMEEGDELTIPHPQKIAVGVNIGYPLRLYVAGLQWTEMWARKAPMLDLQKQVNALMDADVRWIIRELKRALFLPTNFTYNDRFHRNKIDLAVKRLLNADGAPIPPGPNSESFDGSTHTHYLARAGGALASTDVDALLTTIKHHFRSGEIRLYINQADEAAVRNFTGFVGYVDARITVASTTAYATGRTLDPVQIYNRPIGIYNGVEVFTRHWMPANYMYAFNATAPKPVVYRYDPDYGRELHLIYGFPGQYTSMPGNYPLQARGYRRLFGFGIRERHNGAILYHGATSYSAPAIAA